MWIQNLWICLEPWKEIYECCKTAVEDKQIGQRFQICHNGYHIDAKDVWSNTVRGGLDGQREPNRPTKNHDQCGYEEGVVDDRFQFLIEETAIEKEEQHHRMNDDDETQCNDIVAGHDISKGKVGENLMKKKEGPKGGESLVVLLADTLIEGVCVFVWYL